MSKTRALLMVGTIVVYIVCPPYRYYAVSALILEQLVSGIKSRRELKKVA